MSKISFDKVVEEVRALSPKEQQRLRELLNLWLSDAYPQPTEDEFERRLYDAGLLNEVKPVADFTPYQQRKPIELKEGKPISQVIIEERR